MIAVRGDVPLVSWFRSWFRSWFHLETTWADVAAPEPL